MTTRPTTLYTKAGTRYKTTTLSEQNAWGWSDLMAVAAFRYSCGSMTYIAGVCADWLVDMWPQLPPNVRAVIQRDLERDFERDNEDRADGNTIKALGWDCDRRKWEEVRALWGGSATPAPPMQPSALEVFYRAKQLAAEMQTVGEAITHLAQAGKAPGALSWGTGQDLQDAASALAQALQLPKAPDAT